MKILLVDDSGTMRKIQKRLLIDAGYSTDDILEAGNGKEAIQMLEDLKYECDLVLCDVNMPEMNGLETLTAIRAKTKAVPVIMCTSVAEKGTVMESIKLGANNYLVKPFAQDNFISKIKAVIEKK